MGHQQAKWLADHLSTTGTRFDRLVCGALRRHKETMAPIEDLLGITADIDERLNEFDYDALAHRYHMNSPLAPATSREEFLHLLPEIFYAWETDALTDATESYGDFQTRVDEAIEDALELGKSVLVVSSGGPISVTLRRVLGLTSRATSDLLLNIHNSSYHRFQFEAGRLRLSQYNASPHLDGPGRKQARTYV